MKAILEFNLPEDKEQFTVACKASDLWCALHEIMNELHAMRKRSEDNDATAIKAVMNMFWETLNEYGITLEEMT